MAEESLPPVEIAWKLASTTQPLAAGEPARSAVSLFTFEPDDPELASRFPDDRLIYLKFTVSISPTSFPKGTPPVAGAVLGVGIPCFYMQLDLRVRGASDSGTIRPYFHAAAPLARRMVQSGVVGAESFEGDSAGQFMGKSGSQMYESSKSHSTTDSFAASVSGGVPYLSASASFRTTSTDVSGDRQSSQVVDTTTRQASEERRELVSHYTRVENLLTLLSAKYVGTPHLSFSLSPQPLQLLSVDPSDPNLWFSQLLNRRSAGIEGIQEFSAVVLVPRDEDFCVNARLRRVCVFDAPPGPLTYDDDLSYSAHIVRILEYLNRVYPPGTPLDALDLDLVGELPSPDSFLRPAINVWYISPFQMVQAWVVSPAPGGGGVQASVAYKTMGEVWLETVRDEYEREAARSPLERGVLMGEDRFLDTCFALEEGEGMTVSGSSTSVEALFPVGVDLGDLKVGGVNSFSSAARASARQRAWETATHWNQLENRLAMILANGDAPRGKSLRLDDPRMVKLLIERWSTLPSNDRRNLNFNAAADALHLTDEQRRLLKAVGATDLKTIARAIRSAPATGRYNAQVPRLRKTLKAEKISGAVPSAIRFPITPEAAADMEITIGTVLQSGFSGNRDDA
ncbi:MAG TPA: hypothetical protein VJ276_11785 [Thermoanaerobaculia bacterium]|nr:hypothetical protein [Thermoanaerobaculia bacterium]